MRERFANKRMDGLMDSYKSGVPLKFTVVQRCEVIAIACDYPNNYGYDTNNSWTYNVLTEAANNNIEGLNMSRSSIVRTLSTNDLKLQKFKMWLHSIVYKKIYKKTGVNNRAELTYLLMHASN